MKVIAVALALASVGCISRSGPYVTNISLAGRDKLLVERCFVEYNAFLARTATGRCTTSELNLISTTTTSEPAKP
jgi:hypothetical protein